ncbi:MAG: OmpA family protein [Bacteroidetes bacterium]|nr:OmpA family protein [Bacteroidota bacterium]
MKAIKKLLLFAFLCLTWFLSYSQEIPEEGKKIFTNENGNIFVNRQLDVFLLMSTDVDTKNKHIVPSSSNNGNKIRFSRHGLHTFTHIDPITNQQTIYEIFADANPPKTDIKITEGLILKFANRYYCNNKAQITFLGQDENSGVSHTYYSLDKNPYEKWNGKPINLSDKSQYELKFYSVDNVGNIEKHQTVFIYFDTESIIELEDIFFDHNSADLTRESMRKLDELVKSLKDFPELRIMLMSHTDSRGTSSYNLRLSKQRAESVKTYLVSKGIQANRLEAVGYGDTMIRNECVSGVNCSEEKHQENRRTEFKILPFNK